MTSGNLPRVDIGQRILVDKRLASSKEINSRYKIAMYNEPQCNRCDNLPDRPNSMCEACPAFGGLYNLHKSVLHPKTDRPMWSLPIGDIQFIGNELLAGKEFKLRKKYKPVPFKHKIKWTGNLFQAGDLDSDGNPRTNQQELVDKWLETKNGIIRARPRSGKTVMSIYLAAMLGVKTIIIAHQHEILEQFRSSFAGNKTGSRASMTNIEKLEATRGDGVVVKIIKKMSDFDAHPDIAIMTYQTLMADPRRIRKHINKRYSFLICDELHRAGADGYSKVVNRMSMPYRLGLSATTERKDGREALTERTIGPVVAESKTYTLVPTIDILELETEPPTNYKSWTSCMKYLANSKARNVEIVKQVFKDLRAGHKVIILPVFWRGHQDALVQLINHQAKVNRKKRGEKWPKDLGQALHGKANREHVLERVDSGEPCVLVAINSMIKEAIDMKMPTKLYLVVPTSAVAEVGAPMFLQLSYRVCTPMPGKNNPEILVLADKLDIFRGCLTGLFWNEIVPGLKKDNFKYRLAPNAYEKFANLRKKKQQRPKSFGGRAPSKGGGWV